MRHHPILPGVGIVQKTPARNQAKQMLIYAIIELSLENPAFGQQRIADPHTLEGLVVCATTIRNVWKKAGMETKYKRRLKLEESLSEDFELTEAQIRLLEKANPEFKNRPTIHLYEIFLELNDINHRKTKVASPRTNGFVERFSRTILD